MQSNQKIFLFVDGSNLYNSSYALFGPNNYIDFSLLIKSIENHLKITFTQIHFYTSYSKEKKYLQYETLFYGNVKKTKNVIFFKGYRSKTSGKEKEVDVKLAVDLVDFAHRRKFNKTFLFAGDADFMQALYPIRSLGITVKVISMENRIMYRAPFYYQTYIIQFNKKFSFISNPKWKHSILPIFLNKKKLIKIV